MPGCMVIHGCTPRVIGYRKLRASVVGFRRLPLSLSFLIYFWSQMLYQDYSADILHVAANPTPLSPFLFPFFFFVVESSLQVVGCMCATHYHELAELRSSFLHCSVKGWESSLIKMNGSDKCKEMVKLCSLYWNYIVHLSVYGYLN